MRHTGPKFVRERMSEPSVTYQKDEMYFVAEIIYFLLICYESTHYTNIESFESVILK